MQASEEKCDFCGAPLYRYWESYQDHGGYWEYECSNDHCPDDSAYCDHCEESLEWDHEKQDWKPCHREIEAKLKKLARENLKENAK